MPWKGGNTFLHKSPHGPPIDTRHGFLVTYFTTKVNLKIKAIELDLRVWAIWIWKTGKRTP